MDINNIASIKSLIISQKIVHTSFNPAFYMLMSEKSPEIFPRHKGCFF